jgi:hypothetical protein
MKYLRRTTSAAANNAMSITITPLCSVASFEEELRAPTPGYVPRSVCVWGPSLLAVFINIKLELARVSNFHLGPAAERPYWHFGCSLFKIIDFKNSLFKIIDRIGIFVLITAQLEHRKTPKPHLGCGFN